MSETRLTIPFTPLPPSQMIKLSRGFLGMGYNVSKMFPSLERELRQANIPISKEVYGAIIGLVFIFYAILGSILGLIFASSLAPEMIVPGALGLGFIGGLMTAMQVALYPKIMLKKKVRDIERNIIFGLRTILVEIKAGVTLFDAMGIVSKENNGELSNAFEKTLSKIQTGTYQNDALEDLAESTPSIYFRRAIWQLVNGLKSGGDVSTIMQSLVESLSKEKANQVKKYGNSLKMLSLIYMMLGAIMPALGLTFMIILATLPNSIITQEAFYVMLGFLTVAQFMFMGIIKSARPALLGD